MGGVRGEVWVVSVETRGQRWPSTLDKVSMTDIDTLKVSMSIDPINHRHFNFFFKWSRHRHRHINFFLPKVCRPTSTLDKVSMPTLDTLKVSMSTKF